MAYWIHIARSIDRVTLHRERCSEVPSNYIRTDFWEGGWFEYPDKERALAAMEQAGVTFQKKCDLCKP
jgi:hypothetical protein